MDASPGKVLSAHAGWLAVAVAILAATWFLLYPRAGYGTATRVAARLAFLAWAIEGLQIYFAVRAVSVGGGQAVALGNGTSRAPSHSEKDEPPRSSSLTRSLWWVV